VATLTLDQIAEKARASWLSEESFSPSNLKVFSTARCVDVGT